MRRANGIPSNSIENHSQFDVNLLVTMTILFYNECTI
jgi:hypothetical protein